MNQSNQKVIVKHDKFRAYASRRSLSLSISLSFTHTSTRTHMHQVHMCIKLFCDMKYAYNDINTQNIVSEAVRLLIVMNKAVRCGTVTSASDGAGESLL